MTKEHLTGDFSQDARFMFRSTPVFKAINWAWDFSGCGQQEQVGDYAALIKASSPKTLSYWEETYLAHGRSWEQLELLAERFARAAGVSQTNAMLTVLIHVLDEVHEGYWGEIKALRLAHERALEAGRGVRFEFASPEMDREYGVDIAGFVDGILFFGIQVKGAKWFEWKKKNPERALWLKHKAERFEHDFPSAEFMFLNSADVDEDNFLLLPLKSIF